MNCHLLKNWDLGQEVEQQDQQGQLQMWHEKAQGIALKALFQPQVMHWKLCPMMEWNLGQGMNLRLYPMMEWNLEVRCDVKKGVQSDGSESYAPH